jgi:hypothetical protein
MSANTYIQLSIVGIILGSFLFFSNYQSSHAQEFTSENDDVSDEGLDIILPLPSTSGQEQQEGDDSSSAITSNTILEWRQQGQNNKLGANEIEEGRPDNIIDIPLELPFP